MEEKVQPTKMARTHQFLTVVGIPVLLMFAGWLALTFDTMRLDMESTKKDVGYLQNDVAEMKRNFNSVFGYSLKHSETFAGNPTSR